MSLDSSLRIKAGSGRLRSVLTRGERIAKLQEAEKFGGEASPLGLPKVRVQKLSLKKKKKAKEEEPAAGDKKAAGKAAAPAAGAAKKK
jgi:small basic protein (TIGR04137 family)